LLRISLTIIRVAPVCTNLASEVKETLAPVSVIVDRSVLDSTCSMLVDEPVLARSTSAFPNDIIHHLDEQTPPLPPFSTSPSHTLVFPPLNSSATSMSVTSSAAAPLPFVIEHHVPTMPSFTFGIDKCMPPMTARSTDREALPFPSLTLSVEQAQDPQWSFHLPQVMPSPVWNMIDNTPFALESNPWHNVRSVAPPSFCPVFTPSPMPVPEPAEPVVAQKSKVSQWPYSKFMPLSLSPSPSYSQCQAEGGMTSNAAFPSYIPAVAFMESYTAPPAADEVDMVMVIDDPMDIEERPGNMSTSPTRVVEEAQLATSAVEPHPMGTSANTGVIPWKAPSLRKRVHFETMDSDTQSSQSHWNRNDSQSPQPLGERRESKRLKCATCVECNAHDTSPFRGKESWRGRTVKKRASKADLAEDWRLRRKPVLLTTSGAHAEFSSAAA
jgi:hypothetical protein